METKRKSERIIFWGFVILAISYFGMIYYFQVQTDKLDKQDDDLKIKTTTLQIKENELLIRENELKQISSYVPSVNKRKVDSIAIQTNEQIKIDRQQIIVESGIKNVIYIQVSNQDIKSNLINKNFISILYSNGYNVINAYDIVEKGADNSIRYFNDSDKDLAEQLQMDIQKKFSISLKLKFVRGLKVNKGQIEVWIK
jgi:hypothetical protein